MPDQIATYISEYKVKTDWAALADDYILMHGRPKATQKPLWDPPLHPEALRLSPGS